MVLTRTEYEVSVQMAGQADQAALQVGPDTPLLVTGELFIDREDRPAVWVVTRYRSDRIRLYGSYVVPAATERGQ